MAITKIHAIKSTLHKAVDYIENPNKTDGQLLLSGYNTEPQTAALDFEMTATLARKVRYTGRKSQNLAYHLIQSFSPDDDVTPEQAHEIGKRLASEFTDGRFEYVVATHVDKGHLHNHILINAVSFLDYKKLHTVPYRTAAQIRGISDRLCIENELSVIETPQQLGLSYSEYLKKRTKTPMRTQVRKRLNFVLERATSWDEFKQMAAELGVAVNDSGKHISYRLAGAGRAVRGYKLSDTEKYLPHGIAQQIETNQHILPELRRTIRESAQVSGSFASFEAEMKKRGVQVKANRRTGKLTYRMNDADETLVPEDALGGGYSRDAIIAAMESGDFSFAGGALPSLRERFEAAHPPMPDIADTLIAVSPAQIGQMGRQGLVLRVCDRSGAPAQLLIDAEHVNAKAGQTQIAVGSRFSYDIVYADGQHGAIRGGDLIRYLEIQNGVKPLSLELSADQIKSMSLRGVTVTLPDADIQRAFIPAEFVRYDKVAGRCFVDLYANWDYSYLPVNGKENQRKSIKGQALAERLTGSGPAVPDETLRRRIAAVERKGQLAQTKHLAATLLQMKRSGIYSAKDYTPKLRDIQKEIQDTHLQIQTQKQKIKQYAVAARCLQTCQTHKGVWQKYMATPGLLKKAFYSKNRDVIDLCQAAMRQLESFDVRPDIDPDKVLSLIRDREEQVEALQDRLEDLKAQEKELLEQRDTVERVQGTEPTHGHTKQQENEHGYDFY